jgi:hypothetical protein
MNGKLETVVLDPLEIEPDPAQVLRYLGYPAGAAPHESIEQRVHEAIGQSRSKLRPRAIYSLYPVAEHGAHSLTLAGGAMFTGTIGEYLSHAGRAAVFLGTAGPEIVGLSEAAFRSRDTLGGLVFNAIGSHIAEAAAERIIDDLSGRLAPQEALTLRYSPGYCGISLSQQRTIFSLVDAGLIGVELLPTLIMKPVKSVSGLIGMGPKDAVHAYGNPCDRCPLTDCRMRR